MKPYPIFLNDLDQRRTVVLGGGIEAEHKVQALLDCDAMVTLIANDITPGLRSLAEELRIDWIRRDYRHGDLRGAFLVIATTADPELNAQIYAEAEGEDALINVPDDVEHCNFVAGSVVRRGSLVVSVSTSGSAPALAVRLREKLERELGPEYAELLDMLVELRKPLPRWVPDFGARRALWYKLVDSDLLDLLRQGRRDQARRRMREIVEQETGHKLSRVSVGAGFQRLIAMMSTIGGR